MRYFWFLISARVYVTRFQLAQPPRKNYVVCCLSNKLCIPSESVIFRLKVVCANGNHQKLRCDFLFCCWCLYNFFKWLFSFVTFIFHIYIVYLHIFVVYISLKLPYEGFIINKDNQKGDVAFIRVAETMNIKLCLNDLRDTRVCMRIICTMTHLIYVIQHFSIILWNFLGRCLFI